MYKDIEKKLCICYYLSSGIVAFYTVYIFRAIKMYKDIEKKLCICYYLSSGIVAFYTVYHKRNRLVSLYWLLVLQMYFWFCVIPF